MVSSEKILLILDLDETLLHSSEKRLDCAESFCFENLFVYKRPFVDEFLQTVVPFFNLAVWSSGTDDYVEYLAQNIIVPHTNPIFVWGRSRCTQRRSMGTGEYYFVKRLTKLRRMGYPINKMIIVDDSPEKCQCNFGNAIYVPPFLGSTADDELRYLGRYLVGIKNCANVREVEKRGWRFSELHF
jgi:carboxy-terminal domain RNA polymerase II polypeptide A small phosphatase